MPNWNMGGQGLSAKIFGAGLPWSLIKTNFQAGKESASVANSFSSYRGEERGVAEPEIQESCSNLC